MIYRRRKANMHGLLDQEIVANKVAAWSSRRPLDFWVYRPADSDAGQHLLITHQSQWQRRLMLRYGQDLVFLDATYKTTRYALPLFFLCVHTNSGYMVVAIIVMEREDTASLIEAIRLLQQNVPEWNPAAFMTDASEIEITAIRTIFPGSFFSCVAKRKTYYEALTQIILVT